MFSCKIGLLLFSFILCKLNLTSVHCQSSCYPSVQDIVSMISSLYVDKFLSDFCCYCILGQQ